MWTIGETRFRLQWRVRIGISPISLAGRKTCSHSHLATQSIQLSARVYVGTPAASRTRDGRYQGSMRDLREFAGSIHMYTGTKPDDSARRVSIATLVPRG